MTLRGQLEYFLHLFAKENLVDRGSGGEEIMFLIFDLTYIFNNEQMLLAVGTITPAVNILK